MRVRVASKLGYDGLSLLVDYDFGGGAVQGEKFLSLGHAVHFKAVDFLEEFHLLAAGTFVTSALFTAFQFLAQATFCQNTFTTEGLSLGLDAAGTAFLHGILIAICTAD